MNRETGAALLLTGLAISLAVAQPPAKKPPTDLPVTYKWVARWSGHIADRALFEARPKLGVIDSQTKLEKLWKTWMLVGTAPEVNFDEHIVFVRAHLGLDSLAVIHLSVTSEGYARTPIEGSGEKEGFAYNILVFPKPKTTITSLQGEK